MRGEAAPPQCHGLTADLQRRIHAQVGRARFGTGEDDARTLNKRLPGPVSAQQALYLTLLVLAEIERLPSDHATWRTSIRKHLTLYPPNQTVKPLPTQTTRAVQQKRSSH